jgi:hypothetical protein
MSNKKYSSPIRRRHRDHLPFFILLLLLVSVSLCLCGFLLRAPRMPHNREQNSAPQHPSAPLNANCNALQPFCNGSVNQTRS